MITITQIDYIIGNNVSICQCIVPIMATDYVHHVTLERQVDSFFFLFLGTVCGLCH